MRVLFIIIIAFQNESFENWMHSKKNKQTTNIFFFTFQK